MKLKRRLIVMLVTLLALGLMAPQATLGWNATGSLTTGRTLHTATLLNNGKVLVAGGSGTDAMKSCELYNPATGKWTSTGGLNIWRYNHTATLLKNGWVLIAGGITTYGTPTYQAELYKPENNGCTPTNDMKTSRSGHKATLLDDGRVLVAGGSGDASCEIFDPASGQWKLAGAQLVNRSGFTATTLLNSKVLTAGGSLNADPWYSKNSELFTPVASPGTGTWANTGDLKVARGYQFPAARLLDGRVLVMGGFDGTGGSGTYWQTSAEIFDPAGNGGGGSWTLTAGPMKRARIQHTATCLNNGWVLVAGGQGPNPPNPPAVLTSAELFNPASGTWADATPLTTARMDHTATLLANGFQVLVVGGETGNGVGLKSCELYVPPGSVNWPSRMLLFDEESVLPEGEGVPRRAQ